MFDEPSFGLVTAEVQEILLIIMLLHERRGLILIRVFTRKVVRVC